MSTRVLGLVRASHPEPAAAVTVVAALLAAGVGHSAAGVAAVALTVLASQLAVGWSNDLIDADRDAAVGRTDKPVTTGEVARPALARATTVAAVAVPVLALAGGPAAAACATLGLVSALLYNRPLKSTPVSVLPYAVSFGALPAFVVLALPGSPVPPAWLLAAAALLGAGAHFANVLPDLADDARTGVRGLPHRLGPAGSRLAAAGLLLAATVALVLGPPGPPSWTGLSAVAAAVAVPAVGWYAGRAAAGRSATAFRAVLVVALIDVVLLVSSGRVV
ncbi:MULTISPECIES: UbiA family prenyltransferase [unclassified Micromonospora]|uniref:UbiA family prenyltransferase n=1 Tax=unclassified Micromonospora TaxID=2617518 RepID=UPI0020B1CB12|nr:MULTISPECIES: UbiA family prenyltransferase [unclassified Micromonospora]MDM4783089.1 UbiA family prenyltransferase [Micromonospora sp. b486]